MVSLYSMYRYIRTSPSRSPRAMVYHTTLTAYNRYIRTSYISKPVSRSHAITSSSSQLMTLPKLLLGLLSSALELEPRVLLFFFLSWQRGHFSAALGCGFEGELTIRVLGHLSRSRLLEEPPTRVYSHVSWSFSLSKYSISDHLVFELILGRVASGVNTCCVELVQ